MIEGKVYIVPDAATRSWKMVVHNTGNEVLGVTNNIFATRAEAATGKIHDDHVNYGHGLTCQPGSVSWQEFKEGAAYNQRPIQAGQHLRLGIRYAAHMSVELPPLSSAPIEIDFKDFTWYNAQGQPGGVKGQAPAHSTIGMDNWAAQARNPLNRNVANGPQMLHSIQQAMAARRVGIKGTAAVTAVPNHAGMLSHWEVRFDNAGKIPFIGTATFEGANKNDGLGLESMACPGAQTAAVQRIEAKGNYGVAAEPGVAKLRLGIRGFGHKTVALPHQGSLNISTDDFIVDTSQVNDEFFDLKMVQEKRNEKAQAQDGKPARVQFFENGRAINEELKPITYTGAAAKARSTFDPPTFAVRAVDDAPETPGGGWVVELKNRLPAKDERGKVGFVATLRLGDTGWDPAQLPPKKFEAPNETKEWFIPKHSVIGGVTAQTGTHLTIGTRGLGWFAEVKLPHADAPIDGDAAFDTVWRFREDQYNRGQLQPEFTSRCKH